MALGVFLGAGAVALYFGSTAPLPVVDLPEVLPAPAVALTSVVERSGDSRAYLDALLARGLTLEETKPLVFERLQEESARAARDKGADEYWRSDFAAAAVEVARARIAAADRARAQLLELYGAQARRDPVFAPLFAPLDARYVFLASEQQLALQKVQIARQSKQAKSAPVASAAAASATESMSARVSATATAMEELRAALGADAALQYLYRFSPLADQLRSANVDLTGPEFRAAFAALLEFEAAADPHAFTHVRDALRTALGDVRFTRLWAVRDPLFGVLAVAGRQQGLAEGAIAAAYAILNDAQDRLAAAADRFAVVDSQRAAEELRGVQQDMQQRLANLVGQEAADALMHASTHLSISMQQTSSTNPRE